MTWRDYFYLAIAQFAIGAGIIIAAIGSGLLR